MYQKSTKFRLWTAEFNLIVIIFKRKKEIRNNQMTHVYKIDFRIFDKDSGQGFTLPENLDFN